MSTKLRVLVETAPRKTFASALDWPGWSRSARDEDGALATLLDYAARYEPVVQRTGVRWPGAGAGHWRIEVAESVPGNASTDFGIPDAVASDEDEPLTAARATRFADLVVAAWAQLDEVVGSAPADLRKGPRGGGRDRDPMLRHVLESEVSYAKKLGLDLPPPTIDDTAAIAANRAAIEEVLRSGQPRPHPRRSLWPAAYAARRIAWHALDHAWEMEDRG